jgi:hypothetical protein
MTQSNTDIQILIKTFAIQLARAIGTTITNALADSCNDVLEQPLSLSPTKTASEEPTPVRQRKPMTITPERRKAMQIHGQYLGALRALSKKNRAVVKKVSKEKGLRSAIKAAKSLRTEKKPEKSEK